jgi:hypothetical protein
VEVVQVAAEVVGAEEVAAAVQAAAVEAAGEVEAVVGASAGIFSSIA